MAELSNEMLKKMKKLLDEATSWFAVNPFFRMDKDLLTVSELENTDKVYQEGGEIYHLYRFYIRVPIKNQEHYELVLKAFNNLLESRYFKKFYFPEIEAVKETFLPFYPTYKGIECYSYPPVFPEGEEEGFAQFDIRHRFTGDNDFVF